MARGANEAWHRFRRDAAALPSAAWVRWLRTLLIGFLATTGLALALVWAGKQLVGLGMQAWDRALLLLTALSAAVGYARLRMGTHWPSDIIAGTLIGVAWLATVAAALDRAEKARA